MGIRATRHQSLLAYLLFNRHLSQQREHVAFVFWSESEEAQALNNLRKALHHIRRQLPYAERFIHSDAKTVQWRPDSAIVCTFDVSEFEDRLESIRRLRDLGDIRGAHASLRLAVELYRGDLLPSCYDDWILAAREQLRDRYLNALGEMTELLEGEHQFAEAIQYANQRLRTDPLSEQAYRHLMQLHIYNEDPGSALRVYHTCATMLKSEFGTVPSQLTQTLYEHLMLSSSPSPTILTSPMTTQMVGRDMQWKQLQQTWAYVLHGHTHCVVVTGEAGIGKTRLIEEFCTWLKQRDILVTYTRAYAAEGALAFSPIADWLRVEDMRTRWQQQLDSVWLTELARIVPELLVEMPELERPQPINESWQRKRLFEAMAHAVTACGWPLVLALDDLQWCDRETLECLHFLLRYSSDTPLLFVGGLRLGEVRLDHGSDHPLASLLFQLHSHAQVVEIELGPLDLDATAALATSIIGKTLSQDSLEQLFHDSQGNPLFASEIVRSSFEGSQVGASGFDTIVALPRKVQAMIQARLSQLSPAARSIADMAAIMGREFAADVLTIACRNDVTVDLLVSGLDELWQRRIVRERGTRTYDFSHDRIRDVVLASMGPAQRRQLHRYAAEALETLHVASLSEISAQLAAHYDEAGDADQAMPHYFRAANVLHELFAFRDEKLLLEKGLRCLMTLPNSQIRDRHKLSLLLALASAYVFLSGISSEEMRRICEAALPLCNRQGYEEDLFRAQRGLWLHYLCLGRASMAAEYASKNLALSKVLDRVALVAESERCLGIAMTMLGHHLDAIWHFDQAVRLNPPENMLVIGGVLESGYGLDYMVWSSIPLWIGGYSAQALVRNEQGMALSRASQIPFNIVIGLEFVGRLHCYLRQFEIVHQAAVEMLDIATRYEFGDYVNVAKMLLGWAMVHGVEADRPRALLLINEGIAGCIAVQMFADLTFYYALLAEVQFMVDQIYAAIATLDNAIALAEQNGERYWLSELYRLKGEYHHAIPIQDSLDVAVENYFVQALEIARVQMAKSLELRAAMSLTKLMVSQDRYDQALQLLKPIYDWFSEGMDTHDLVKARKLLHTLSSPGTQPRVNRSMQRIAK